jgi:hypothetical protein
MAYEGHFDARALLTIYLAMGSWQAAQSLVESQPELLGHHVSLELDRYIERSGGDQAVVEALMLRRAVLRRCAQIGVVGAFSEVRSRLGDETAVIIQPPAFLDLISRLSLDDEAELRVVSMERPAPVRIYVGHPH